MMMPRLLQVVVWIAGVSLASLASADVVTDWNTAALDAIRASQAPPPIASRALAILHVSIYDAINGIARTHEPYAVRSAAPASASKEAAASAAARTVLVAFFPMSTPGFDAVYAEILGTIPDTPQKLRGVAWGELVADEILAMRAGDGSDAVVAAPSVMLPGFW